MYTVNALRMILMSVSKKDVPVTDELYFWFSYQRIYYSVFIFKTAIQIGVYLPTALLINNQRMFLDIATISV